VDRIKFLLFGSSNFSPHVRRMLWRLGGAGFICGFLFGFTEPDAGAARSETMRLALGGVLLLGFMIMNYESWIFFRRSDELTQHVFVQSIALAGILMFCGVALLAITSFVFGPTFTVSIEWLALGALIITTCSWFYAALKST
jgi:hypothetical protein